MLESNTKSGNYYQERLEWWFYFTRKKIVPINMSEEGMSLGDKLKQNKNHS